VFDHDRRVTRRCDRLAAPAVALRERLRRVDRFMLRPGDRLTAIGQRLTCQMRQDAGMNSPTTADLAMWLRKQVSRSRNDALATGDETPLRRTPPS
jgi:hypothetical protein